MKVLGSVLFIILMTFMIVLIFRLVMEYVRMFSRSWEPARPMKIVLEAVYTVTDPPLNLLRRFLPPLRLGGATIDLSFFVLMIIVWILISAVGWL
jgi:YggT family protein